MKGVDITVNKEDLQLILPHRDNMLLLDEAYLKDDKAYCKYCFRGDEWFFQGHFPGNPVVPGVILCEILAQSAAILLGAERINGCTPFFAGLDKVRFKQPVLPGDVFETESVILRERSPFYFAQGQGFVSGKLCVRADFSVALIKR